MREWLWGVLIAGFLVLGIRAWAPVAGASDEASRGACDRIVGYGVIPPSFANGRYQECLRAAALRAPGSPVSPVGLVAQSAP